MPSPPKHRQPEAREAEDRAIDLLRDALAEAENNGYLAALGYLSLAEEAYEVVDEYTEQHRGGRG